MPLAPPGAPTCKGVTQAGLILSFLLDPRLCEPAPAPLEATPYPHHLEKHTEIKSETRKNKGWGRADNTVCDSGSKCACDHLSPCLQQ